MILLVLNFVSVTYLFNKNICKIYYIKINKDTPQYTLGKRYKSQTRTELCSAADGTFDWLESHASGGIVGTHRLV